MSKPPRARQLTLPLVLTDWRRSDDEIARIELVSVNGRTCVSIRVHELRPDGTFRPTKAGLTFGTDRLDQVIRALERARELVHPRRFQISSLASGGHK